jgi:pSer/pThr/pTyr-binding forkhead associated (FHA) protein
MKVVLKIKSPGKEIFFEAGTVAVTIGRGDKAKIQVKDENCSRVHCKFYIADGKLWVEDMASKNGTFINGIQKTKCQLFLNDKVLIGDTEILVTDEKNSTKIKSKLKFLGNDEDRQRAKLEIEDTEAITQVRVNPLQALKSGNMEAIKASKLQLDSNPLFKDSRTPVPEFRSGRRPPPLPKETPPWKRNLASLIDLSIFLIAVGLPPYVAWFGKSSRARISNLGSPLEMKQALIVGGLSLFMAGLVFYLNNKGSGGSIGERFLGVRPKKD